MDPMDDVKSRLTAAKLPVDSILRPSQLIRFDTENNDELILMQLDKTTLDAVEAGQELIIRGMENDTSVLCTADETYDLKETKTSNSLILLNDSQLDKDNLSTYPAGADRVEAVGRNAVCLKSSYLELKRIVPDTSRLRELVSQSPYKGPTSEEDYSDAKLYSLLDLLDMIPASHQEIVTSLKELGACFIDGYWRTLDFEYVVECMCIILRVVDSESWSCDDLNFVDLVQKVNDSGELVPFNIVDHLIAVYGTREGDRCSFIMTKLSRFFAEMLLQSADSFDFNEFIEVWGSTMPSGMSADEENLAGLALIDKTAKPPTIKRFSAKELPQDTEKRFHILFNAREKWTMKEISPYLEDLCLQGQKISSILTRYARSSLTGGEKVYSSRKTS